MAPDIDSMPPSPLPPSMSDQRQLPPRRISLNTTEPFRAGPSSPRSPSLSLQAAALTNAGLQQSHGSDSPGRGQGLERRRSSLANNLSLNDPTIPAPGEMQRSNGSSNSGSPRFERRSLVLPNADRHHRQPCLGELHQELESEQEAQVNRLLHMIRIQQDQLAATQRPQQTPHSTSPSSPTIDSISGLPTPSTTSTDNQTSPRLIPGSHPSSSSQGHFNRPHSLSRNSSSARYNATATSSTAATSPSLRRLSSNFGSTTRPAEDFFLGGGGSRDECAFYQAETQTLTRENQMLKSRIRELERQISEMNAATNSPSQQQLSTGGGSLYSPVQASPLTFTDAGVAGGGDRKTE